MILFRYILKNLSLPFVFSLFTIMSVLLLQFLMKFADRLVGKGLSLWIIVKLIAYNLAWMVVLVVPMAVLVACLMAYGTMAQNNEIAIMKATGVSLYKMMVPPFFASIVVFFLLIQFNNHIYPDANLAARMLTHDISRKKPTLSLVPGVFSQEVQNYAILARKINQETNELEQVTIYDYSNPTVENVVTAQSGKIYFSRDQKKLLMDLYNGEIHEAEKTNRATYRRLKFEKHKIAMNADQFTFQQSTPGGPRGDRELGAPEMLVIVDSLKEIRNSYIAEVENQFEKNFLAPTDTMALKHNSRPGNIAHVYLRAEDKIRAAQNQLRSIMQRLDVNLKNTNRYWVEIHKKYSIPFACIVFVLIGVPLGTMTRRGGFGVAAGISVIFFLVYWAFLIGGEKLADRGLISPFIGMWSANILLLILGIFLMIKSAKERVTINFEIFSKLVPKQFRMTSAENENTR